MENLEVNVSDLKRKMLEAVHNDLKAEYFEVPGTGTEMISALAELLIFFSLGNAAERASLSQEEREWWKGFCQSLADASESGAMPDVLRLN